VSTPLVSCVVPVHNGAEHLGEALESILAQRHRPLEVVVVDDGSTDASGAVALGYGHPVRVVRRDHALGPGAARSTGVRAASGDVVAFLDADDLWHRDKLATQLPHLDGPPALDVSFSVIENFWDRGHEEERDRWHAAGRLRSKYHFGSLVARRGVFDRVPLPSTRRHTDLQAWVLALREAGVHTGELPEVLTYRRRHATNFSRTDDLAEIHDEYLDLVKTQLARRRGRAGA
jgi:glycosyltransferase involved in cell wall biosynthesis